MTREGFHVTRFTRRKIERHVLRALTRTPTFARSRNITRGRRFLIKDDEKRRENPAGKNAPAAGKSGKRNGGKKAVALRSQRKWRREFR